MTDHAKDIASLKAHIAELEARCKAQHEVMTDMVAERNALRKRVEELEALSKPLYITHGQRVESIDLRERLVCAIWPQILHQYRASTTPFDPFNDAREDAVIEADKMIAAMRKGEA